jgi:hypothetical protein
MVTDSDGAAPYEGPWPSLGARMREFIAQGPA